ncbi:unnamed protein product [Lactuca virosa]|uniref:DUF223 domain-containing protein n=1 Tax=Lactuca virosa TaxID=75947 RepID=A0AAU9LN10_9ASTR|nr:unnamed protein product [Lactuca virosa]
MGDCSVTLIDDVDALRDDLTLKVRVINLWNHMSFYNKDDIWAIELILLDEKDGSSFYITRPSVASQKPGSFKLTPQDQKLTFVQDTVVTECAEFSGSKFGFSFVEYQSILSFLRPQDTSVDVIGLVVAVSEMMRDNSDKSKQRLTIHIQDANALQLRVILWGDYAYKMQNYIDNNPPNQHVVVILQFAQITIWRDRPSVNTYFTSSKLFINSEIDEITLFKKSLDVDDRPDSSSNTISVIESKQLSEFDDFIVRTKLKTIAEIFEPLEVNDAKDDTNVHQSNAKSISYECHNRNCTKTTTSVVPRFMIPIRVQDNTGTITLTMFEKEGRYLLKSSAKELVKRMTQSGDSTKFFPGKVNALKGLKLAFKISVTDFNVSKKTINMELLESMAASNVTLIADLDVLRDDLTFKLRVINLWNQKSFYNKDELYLIELILIDEQGNKIQANVSRKNIYRFIDILKDGHAFYIKCLIFASENVIGLVVGIGDMWRDNADVNKHRLIIQIQDANGLQLSVALLGHYAYTMQNFIDNNVHNLRMIVILQFAMLKVWRGRPTVNTYCSVTKLFIDTDIDEINVFKKS